MTRLPRLRLFFVFCLIALGGNLESVRADDFALAQIGFFGTSSGTSSGGVFSLDGSILNNGAMPLSGGAYQLIGGFRPVGVSVQIQNGPVLRIQVDSNGITISWTPNLPGFELQTCRSLSAAEWISVPTAGQNQLTVPLEAGAFFRLVKP